MVNSGSVCNKTYLLKKSTLLMIKWEKLITLNK